MAILKCKMCGGDIEVSADRTFGTCECCGSTMTFPKVSDEQRADSFNRGNHFRRIGEFDKALQVYEHIVAEDPSDAEAHWCCALCRFGIEYVEDPISLEYIPTCHRASFDIFTEDVDYLAALNNADGITKKQYQKDALKITEVQQGILRTSQNEKPFDVFICYKESDENGNRTVDSTLAQDIYYQLTDAGLRVFFARITLEDKVGSEYEPYIFAALNSAKAMVVVGTRPDYFNAVWVKNEWSRYLAIVKHDRKKIILPCYKDMDPYDLPEQLSVLQSYDMAKIGFIQDLIRGIKKIVESDAPKTTVKETVVVNNSNTAPLLKRAFMFLEDGNWQEADDYCEKVLDIDPENAQAYLGKLMAELHICQKENLKNCAKPFNDNNNYQKAVRFGDEKLAQELQEYIDFINDRNENTRLTEIYNNAKNAMNTAKKEADFKAAAETFLTIPGFKDADNLAEQCIDKAEKCRLAKEEADRLEAQHKAEERRIAAEKAAKKRKKAFAIGAPIVVAYIAFVIVLTTVIIPKQKFNEAMKMIDSGQCEEAYMLLRDLPDKYSSEYLKKIIFVPSTKVFTDSNGKNDTIKQEYDSKGNCLKMTMTYSGVTTCTYNYEYDSKGNKIKEIYTCLPDNYTRISKYEYDSNGNMTKEISTDSDGTTDTYNYEYEYDSNGNLVKEIQKSSDGSPRIREYEYDSNGNLTKETEISDSDTYISTYEYDSKGNLAKNTCTNSEGYTSASEHEYEYDSKGNMTKDIITHSNGSTETVEYSGYLCFYNPNFVKNPLLIYYNYG